MTEKGDLYENIMNKLKFSPDIDESNISIAIKDKQIVVLGGTVKSYTEKYLAEEAIEKIAQVRAVANELKVDLLSTYLRSDADIAKAALNALQWSTLVPFEKIKIAVADGHLTLNGNVEYNFQKIRAEKAVQDLRGVTYVTNNIKIQPLTNPFKVQEKIIQEFERNARIDASNIQVEVNGNTVTLKGSVRNFDENKEATEAAWSVPGISNVINQLTIN